jgi:hypothetical protein
MLRTGRIARRGRTMLTWTRELRLPPPERRAAKAERESERQMRRERDNEHNAAARAAALEAEAQRYKNYYTPGG